MSELTLLFEGSNIESEILKNRLETAGIGAMVKNEENSAAIAGFGAIGSCAVYVLQGDSGKASEVLEAFKSSNSQ